MNFSGNEWVLLGVLVVPAVIAAAVVAGRRAAARRRQVLAGLDGRQVRGTPDAVRQSLQLQLAGVRKLTAVPAGTDTLMLERSFFPAWTILVAIMFFPLGLLALLAKQTDTATVLLAPMGNGAATKVRVAGTLDKRTVRALSAALQ